MKIFNIFFAGVLNMRKRLNESIDDAFIVIVMAFLVAVFIIFYSLSIDLYKFDEPIYNVMGWDISTNEADKIVTMSRKITSDIQEKTLCTYTSDSIVKAYIDDTEIYSYDSELNICRTPGSAWQLIKVPLLLDENNTSGRTLTITICSVYEHTFKREYTFEVGTLGDVILNKVYKELGSILIIVVLMIAGAVLIVIYNIKKYKKVSSQYGSRKELYLGIFAIIAALWIGCTLFSFQLIVPSGVLHYFIYYTLMMLAPLVLILYLKEIFACFDSGVYFYTHTIAVFIVTLLQILKIQEYAESEPIYLCVLGIEIVVMIYNIIKDYKQDDAHASVLEIVAMGMLGAAIIINAVMYLADMSGQISISLTASSVLIYVIASVYTSIANIIPAIINSIENEKLGREALLDGLTGLKNRRAFEKAINNAELSSMYISVLDLNNLKFYNDTQGHSIGDELIKSAANIIKEVYGDAAYRTGGDEFAILRCHIDADIQSQSRGLLIEKAKEFTRNNKRDLVLEIACGDSSYRNGDSSYEDIYKRADHNMYDHKKFLKQGSVIKSIR